MQFWAPKGSTFRLITLLPEHIAGCGRRLKRAPSMAFSGYTVVPIRRASSPIPTTKDRLEMQFLAPTGPTFRLITLLP